MSATATPPRSDPTFDAEEQSPLARLTPAQIEQLGREFDAIHDEVYADLGDRDARYIRATIKLHRQLVLGARVALLFPRRRPLWLAGTAALSLAKILENMEIGHNVMHGQWDWMNDPDINSKSWDWDTASPADAWRHSHNYEHHTFTNIRGKDRDLGYEIMRIDPHQKWHPAYLMQPLYNLLLMAFFEWGVAMHDLNFDAIRAGDKPKAQALTELKAIGLKARRHGQLHGQHRPQPVGLLDHLLRALPRPDLHVQRGGGGR
jgi:linoleoyl-CoA desaturase